MAIIDGQQLAVEVLEHLKQEIKEKNLSLQLAAVTIGNDPALKKFVELKKKAAHSIGLEFSSYELEEDASLETVKESLAWLSQDPDTHGILLELPVPKKFNTQEILDLVSASKDVDVLTTEREK